jgi:endonuclease III
MPKRKRDNNWNGSDVDIIVDKKPKRRRKHPDRGKEAGQPAKSGDFAAGAVAPLTVPPPKLNTTLVQSQIEELVPPPGLSKAARKRWKKRQKKLLLESASSGAPQLPHRQQGQNASQDGTQASSTSQSTKPHAKTKLNTSFLKGFGVTHLMPRRAREWHNERPAGNSSGLEDAESNTKRLTNEDGRNGSQIAISSDEESDSTDDRESESNHPEARVEVEAASSSNSLESSSISGNDAVEETSPTAQNLGSNRATVLDAVSNLKIHIPNAVTGRAGSTNLLAPPHNTSIRRLSFGSRATSIPSHSDNPDVVNSFKRFSEYLHPDGSSSEDDETDDYESLASANDLKPSRSNKAEELMHHITAAPGPENADTNEIEVPSSLEKSKLIDEDEEDDQLPRFSDSFYQSISVNGASWPANVGIKRQLSFLGQEPGGTPSGSGADLESEAQIQPDLFDDNDDSQELLRTVDEISSSVFGSTRPLPASKPPMSPDPKNGDQENGVLTCVSSDRRMTRSMSTPKTSQSRDAGNDTGLIPNPVGSLDASKELPTTTKSVEESKPKGSEDLSESMSENIDVAIPGSVGDESDIAKTSSSLSELSRSPSPPANEQRFNSNVREKDEQDLEREQKDVQSAVAEPEAEPVPRKKRKMTGRTSKHFTPQKKARRRSSIADEVLDTVPGKHDERESVKVEDIETVNAATSDEPPQNFTMRTRASSKTEKYEKSDSMIEDAPNADASAILQDEEKVQPEEEPVAHSTRSATKKRKTTGKRSAYFTPQKPPLDPTIIDRVDFYNTTAKKKPAPASTSIAPVPPITSARFGIIQEKLWQEPFWLLIAVTFLNKTTGRAAVPVFWALKEKYATPEALAEAEQEELRSMIHHLGLQNQRSKRMIEMARAWVERPPEKGRRWATKNYPEKYDHQQFRKVDEIGDSDDCAGALEIGHLPGTGPYACDSWRIFCRDVLRGVAEDFNGKGAAEGFVPEWQKVVPLDKELRACLRWMWLREGWIWNHENGEKRLATEEMMEKALQGEMEIEDPQERKFAAQAAGVEVSPFKVGDGQVDEGVVEEAEVGVEDSPVVDLREQMPKTPEPEDDEEESESDNIIVTPVVSQRKKRTRRNTRLSI